MLRQRIGMMILRSLSLYLCSVQGIQRRRPSIRSQCQEDGIHHHCAVGEDGEDEIAGITLIWTAVSMKDSQGCL